MKKIIYSLMAVTALLGFAACEADFDPNQPWEEKMLVYGLLDQDDDTTFVRVEKCFLGTGNVNEFAKNKDSIYYAPDELDVKMYAAPVWDTANITDTFTFEYTTAKKNPGDFYYSDDCPVYYCVTKNRLNVWYYYKLVVTNKKTGTSVSSSAYLIAKYSIRPTTFTFSNKKAAYDRLLIEWYNFDESDVIPQQIAKQYQINIRFNYLENGKIEYIDIPINTRVNTLTRQTMLSIYISINDIVGGIKVQLRDKTNVKWYNAQPFEVRILACDLAMYDYISINNSTQNNLNYTPVYTNINGGYGLFAARRTHIYQAFTDKQVDNKIKKAIGELGLIDMK